MHIDKISDMIAHFIGLFLAMCVICVPGLWVVLNSFRPTVEIMAKPPVWIPESISLDAYRAMFSGAGQGGVPVHQPAEGGLVDRFGVGALADLR